MKLRIILLCLVVLPLAVNAEIYKWKDKDGKVRYSDVPPPSNMQTESLYGKKIPRPTGQPPLAPVEGDATVAANKQKEMDKAGGKEVMPQTKQEEAAKRAKDAEEKKKADYAKAESEKIKQENCKTAQNQLTTYTAGGRMTRINEKGEREYLSDADIASAKGAAQADVEKYCGS
ncbi:MAG TPA: DUF4124 domain-containing protein [Methylotenera sp.]|nr:DUF4124 domain-containing protein [Methylotenera sp.]